MSQENEIWTTRATWENIDLNICNMSNENETWISDTILAKNIFEYMACPNNCIFWL